MGGSGDRVRAGGSEMIFFAVIIVAHVFPLLLSSTAKRVGGILFFVFVRLKTDKGEEYFYKYGADFVRELIVREESRSMTTCSNFV